MAKTYWIGTYRAVTNPDKLAAYAQARRAGDHCRRRQVHRPRHAGEDL